MNRVVDLYAKEVRRMNADYDASRENFQHLFTKFGSDRKTVQQQLMATHFKIKSLTTDKEWQAFADIEGEVVSSVLQKSLLKSQSSKGGK